MNLHDKYRYICVFIERQVHVRTVNSVLTVFLLQLWTPLRYTQTKEFRSTDIQACRTHQGLRAGTVGFKFGNVWTTLASFECKQAIFGTPDTDCIRYVLYYMYLFGDWIQFGISLVRLRSKS
jgi:hypothetical protein